MSVASQVDILTATILINASLSDVLDVGGHKLAAIIMPAAWTTAGLSVVGCDTAGGTFLPVYDDLGTEITITAAASRIISIDSVAGGARRTPGHVAHPQRRQVAPARAADGHRGARGVLVRPVAMDDRTRMDLRARAPALGNGARRAAQLRGRARGRPVGTTVRRQRVLTARSMRVQFVPAAFFTLHTYSLRTCAPKPFCESTQLRTT